MNRRSFFRGLATAAFASCARFWPLAETEVDPTWLVDDVTPWTENDIFMEAYELMVRHAQKQHDDGWRPAPGEVMP